MASASGWACPSGSGTASSRPSSAGTAKASPRAPGASRSSLPPGWSRWPTWSRSSTAQAAPVLAGLDEASSWDAVISAEPAQGRRLTGPEFDAALEAIADFTDVKSPYTIGHSRGVADLAGEAARILGLGDQAATTVRRAGLVHDLGRLGVPNAVWDKPGPLGHAETERVRLHPYLTERMLTC